MRIPLRVHALAAAGAVSLALAACAARPEVREADPVPPAPPNALPCPSDASRQSQRVLGNAGGSVEAGGQRLTVPRGALRDTVTFRLVEPIAEYVLVHAYPDGIGFGADSATLTLSYRRCPSVTPQHTPAVFRWNVVSQQWDPLPSVHDPANRTVTATLDHLSGYAIGGS